LYGMRYTHTHTHTPHTHTPHTHTTHTHTHKRGLGLTEGGRMEVVERKLATKHELCFVRMELLDLLTNPLQEKQTNVGYSAVVV